MKFKGYLTYLETTHPMVSKVEVSQSGLCYDTLTARGQLCSQQRLIWPFVTPGANLSGAVVNSDDFDTERHHSPPFVLRNGNTFAPAFNPSR
jgi:hypothetical protein